MICGRQLKQNIQSDGDSTNSMSLYTFKNKSSSVELKRRQTVGTMIKQTYQKHLSLQVGGCMSHPTLTYDQQTLVPSLHCYIPTEQCAGIHWTTVHRQYAPVWTELSKSILSQTLHSYDKSFVIVWEPSRQLSQTPTWPSCNTHPTSGKTKNVHTFAHITSLLHGTKHS